MRTLGDVKSGMLHQMPCTHWRRDFAHALALGGWYMCVWRWWKRKYTHRHAYMTLLERFYDAFMTLLERFFQASVPISWCDVYPAYILIRCEYRDALGVYRGVFLCVFVCACVFVCVCVCLCSRPACPCLLCPRVRRASVYMSAHKVRKRSTWRMQSSWKFSRLSPSSATTFLQAQVL